MNLPTLEPIEYRGELVALVSPTRIRLIAPSVRDRPADDYARRFVISCVCCCEALNGRFPGEYSNAAAEIWAERAMRVQGVVNVLKPESNRLERL
jgi:hypothetical protein